MSHLGVSGLHPCFFADDVVLSASVVGDLQRTLEKFAAECEDAVIRINLTLSLSLGKQTVEPALSLRDPSDRSCVTGSSSQEQVELRKDKWLPATVGTQVVNQTTLVKRRHCLSD